MAAVSGGFVNQERAALLHGQALDVRLGRAGFLHPLGLEPLHVEGGLGAGHHFLEHPLDLAQVFIRVALLQEVHHRAFVSAVVVVLVLLVAFGGGRHGDTRPGRIAQLNVLTAARVVGNDKAVALGGQGHQVDAAFQVVQALGLLSGAKSVNRCHQYREKKGFEIKKAVGKRRVAVRVCARKNPPSSPI